MPRFQSRRPLGSGDLTELIIIETEVERDDDVGGKTRFWEQHAQAWAKISALRGREAVEEGAERAKVVYRVTIYRDPTITAAMRIRWGSTLMNIRKVPEVPGHTMFVEFEAEAGSIGAL